MELLLSGPWDGRRVMIGVASLSLVLPEVGSSYNAAWFQFLFVFFVIPYLANLRPLYYVLLFVGVLNEIFLCQTPWLWCRQMIYSWTALSIRVHDVAYPFFKIYFDRLVEVYALIFVPRGSVCTKQTYLIDKIQDRANVIKLPHWLKSWFNLLFNSINV